MADYRIPQIKQPRPRRRANRKLLFLLFAFFLIVLAVIFFRSPYSKVHQIQVFGNDTYASETIVEASGLVPGMQFLNVWEAKVKKGLARLPGVKDVTVVRHFPGVVELHVQEYERVALFTTAKGERYPLMENGVLLNDVPFHERVVDRPLIRSWGVPDLLDELGKALAGVPPAVLAEISEIALTPTAYDKQRVTLYMKDGNEVQSVITQLAKKLPWYPAIVKEIPPGEKGVIYLLESDWFRKYDSPESNDAGDGQEKAENS